MVSVEVPEDELELTLNQKYGWHMFFGLTPINSKMENELPPPKKLINCKLRILELAEYLKNASQLCKIKGVSRYHKNRLSLPVLFL